MRTYLFIILVCGLLLTGCGEKETVTATESIPEPAVKPTMVEQVNQSADDIAKQVVEMVETGTQLVKETAGEAKQAVEKVVATATENVTAAAAVAKQKTAEIVDTSKQKLIEVTEQLKQEGTQLLTGLEKNPATTEAPESGLIPSIAAIASSVTASSEVITEIQVSETLVIENKKGNVTLSHAEHGKLYGCAPCHGDAVPGAFELEKDTAHATCKGCHKEQGGPTKCSGCHKK